MIALLENVEINMVNGGNGVTDNATMTIVVSAIECSNEKQCDTTQIVGAFCNGQSSCNVFPSLSFCCGYDPCPSLTKWLMVDYRCSSGTSKSCEIQFGNSYVLTCP
jgi:hypothetical protein